MKLIIQKPTLLLLSSLKHNKQILKILILFFVYSFPFFNQKNSYVYLSIAEFSVPLNSFHINCIFYVKLQDYLILGLYSLFIICDV